MALVVFVVCDFDDEKKETKFLTRDVVTVATHSHAFESSFIHTLTLSAYIFVICKIRNRRWTKTHTQAKRVFSCLLQKSNPPISTLVEQKHGDEESDAVGHGESRRRCPRWYPRNWHTEYVFVLVLIGG